MVCNWKMYNFWSHPVYIFLSFRPTLLVLADRDAVLESDTCGPKELCMPVYTGIYLANTTERSVRGCGEAALCPIILTTCYKFFF